MAELALALVVLGGLAGALAAGLDGWRGRRGRTRWGPGPSAGLALGLLAAGVTTRTGALEALPLTLLAGAAIGGPPFAAAWWLVRRLTA